MCFVVKECLCFNCYLLLARFFIIAYSLYDYSIRETVVLEYIEGYVCTA